MLSLNKQKPRWLAPWSVTKEKDNNYVSIDVVLKKQPEEYTQNELIKIQTAIEEADDYFINNL